MTQFGRIVDGTVVQRQPHPAPGFTEMPDHVICGMLFEGERFSNPEPPEVTAEHVKAECRRRILLVMSEDQQRNTLAAGQAATMQFGADPANWPAELQQRQAQAMADWTEIERLRARSNEIKAIDPIPSDLTDDTLWAE